MYSNGPFKKDQIKTVVKCRKLSFALNYIIKYWRSWKVTDIDSI